MKNLAFPAGGIALAMCATNAHSADLAARFPAKAPVIAVRAGLNFKL